MIGRKVREYSAVIYIFYIVPVWWLKKYIYKIYSIVDLRSLQSLHINFNSNGSIKLDNILIPNSRKMIHYKNLRTSFKAKENCNPALPLTGHVALDDSCDMSVPIFSSRRTKVTILTTQSCHESCRIICAKALKQWLEQRVCSKVVKIVIVKQ